MPVAGGASKGTKPFFFPGQIEFGTEAMKQIASQVLGGAPSVAAEAQANRSKQATITSAASAGLDAADPVTQKRLQDVELQRRQQEDMNVMQLLEFLLSPAGQKGGGSFNFGIG